MTSESAVWEALRPLMKGLDPVRIENVVGVGTPDVNYTRGWIELKNLKGWPKRGGIVKVDHFTNQQRVWVTRRILAGGKVFVLLVVGDEWLLFEGSIAVRYLGRSDQCHLLALCLKWPTWPAKPSREELQKWL